MSLVLKQFKIIDAGYHKIAGVLLNSKSWNGKGC